MLLVERTVNMNMELKRIKKMDFDEVLNDYINSFNETGDLKVNEELLDNSSENILVNGEKVVVDIDMEVYSQIIQKDEYTYQKSAEIGMELHKDLKDINGKLIPRYYFVQKELWAYLTLKYFHSMMVELKLDSKVNEEKIKQFIFNIGTVSRTGIQFYWSMIDKLDSEENKEISYAAFEFIDPVKAVYERTNLSSNKNVLKAFVESIIINGRDSRLKKEARSKFPSYVSCYAGVNIFDVYDYDKLVNLLVNIQKEYFNSN